MDKAKITHYLRIKASFFSSQREHPILNTLYRSSRATATHCRTLRLSFMYYKIMLQKFYDWLGNHGTTLVFPLLCVLPTQHCRYLALWPSHRLHLNDTYQSVIDGFSSVHLTFLTVINLAWTCSRFGCYHVAANRGECETKRSKDRRIRGWRKYSELGHPIDCVIRPVCLKSPSTELGYLVDPNLEMQPDLVETPHWLELLSFI